MLILTTKRLNLSEVMKQDAPFIKELLNSPGWIKYIGQRDVKTIEAAENYIENSFRKSYKKDGFGFYKITLIETGDAIGICGLVKRDFLDEVDIGFALLPGFEGKGYAYEAAKATMEYATEELELKTITGVTSPDNIPSQKLLNKIGLKLVKSIKWQNTNEDVLLFSN